MGIAYAVGLPYPGRFGRDCNKAGRRARLDKYPFSARSSMDHLGPILATGNILST